MSSKRPADTDPITPDLMRALHSGFRIHGLNTDEEVHDYLSLVLGRTVESRKTLTAGDARTVLKDLDDAARLPTPASLTALRKPFPDQAIGKLPRSTCKDCSDSPRKRCDRHQWIQRCSECGNNHSSATMHLDYVGHADITDRLLAVDPAWTWRVWSTEELMALPPALRDAGMWIYLTVCGVTRPGFGDGGMGYNGKPKTGPNAAKEAIGDALRNAAMRFGVALDLWAKGDREWAHAERDDATEHGPDADHSIETGTQLTAVDYIEQLQGIAAQQATTLEALTAKWRHEDLNDCGTAALVNLHPDVLAQFVQRVEAYVAAQKQGANA